MKAQECDALSDFIFRRKQMKNELLKNAGIRKALSPSGRFLIWMLMLLTMLALRNTTQAQTYTDSTFNNSDWTSTTLPFPATATGASSTSAKDTGNGNPAPSRTTIHNIVPGQIIVAHRNLTSTYDPSVQGAITSLSYSYDLRQYNPPQGAGFAYSILVFQDNTYYRSVPVDVVFGTSWQAFSKSGLTAASFVKVSGDSPNTNPDFSCKGTRIQFGYATANSSSGTLSLRGGIDNWTIRIDEKKSCCGAVSEQKITCDKGTYTYTFTVTNTSSQVIQYILLSPPAGATYTVSPPVINLGANPLNPGQSTSVSVTIGNASVGDKICVNVALADKSLAVCCKTQTCVKLPECPCLKTDVGIKCGADGTYTLTIGFQNQTAVPIQEIFAVVTTPSGVNISPQMVTLPTPLQPGQTTSITLTISGISPLTQMCLRLSPLGNDKETCCSVEICFTTPKCLGGANGKTDNRVPDVMRAEVKKQEMKWQLFQSLTGVQYRTFFPTDAPPSVVRL